MTHKIRTIFRQRHMQKSQVPNDTRGERGGGKKQTKKSHQQWTGTGGQRQKHKNIKAPKNPRTYGARCQAGSAGRTVTWQGILMFGSSGNTYIKNIYDYGSGLDLLTYSVCVNCEISVQLQRYKLPIKKLIENCIHID